MLQILFLALGAGYVVIGFYLVFDLGLLGAILWFVGLALIRLAYKGLLRYIGDPMDAYDIERRSLPK